ncbi:MAG TPA: hypothetical protein VFY83_06120, partial [Anaerolineales bacterium]|nr:hypothetical protein [Anaerolineales bacterium]
MTPQEYYQWITVGVGWSIIPILTVHYCRYPLKNRKEELKALFGSKSIRKHYLLRRGFDGADSTNLEGAFD